MLLTLNVELILQGMLGMRFVNKLKIDCWYTKNKINKTIQPAVETGKFCTFPIIGKHKTI